MISCEVKNGKYIFLKDGVYWALDKDGLAEMAQLCNQILAMEDEDKRLTATNYVLEYTTAQS
jgi:hypothetical protein